MNDEEDDDDFFYFQDFFNASRALTVREEDSVKEVVNAELKNHPASERVWLAATWFISRDPDKGTEIPDTDPPRRLFKLLPNEIAKSPGLLVRYYVEGKNICVDWVEFTPYDKTKAVAPAAYVYRPPGKK